MTEMLRLDGIPASPGIAIALARVVDRGRIKIPKRAIQAKDVEAENKRLMSAVDSSKIQLKEARNAIKASAGSLLSDHSLIIDSHLMMLEDELLIDGTVGLIRDRLINAEWALFDKIEELKATLDALGDDYFKERTEDVAFVGNRVLRNMLGHVTEIVDARTGPCIIVSESLSPAETVELIDTPVMGFVTETGTRTSHTAIMAQTLGIPAIVGVEDLTSFVEPGDTIVVDGNEGRVIVNPDSKTLRDYRGRATKLSEREKSLLVARHEPAVTTDKVAVSLMCNIEFPAEAALALDYGAEGIGLYRTEFAYLNRKTEPEEQELRLAYKAVLDAMAPRPVVFRTFDLGADKLPITGHGTERNPSMGLRAVRLGLKYKDMFKVQLRALLRAAGRGGHLRVMFPMISGVDELRQVKAVLAEAALEVGGDVPEKISVGCMIELPSAVFVADRLAREVDFFSIGTNDLIQYSLAIDRVNDHVAYLYTPFHPGVLAAIKLVIDAAGRAKIPVAMCGNMAAEPLLVPVLIGFGLRSFSMAPTLIPEAKAAIRKTSYKASRKMALEALEKDTAREVEELVKLHIEKG